jgi:hypothetical protein
MQLHSNRRSAFATLGQRVAGAGTGTKRFRERRRVNPKAELNLYCNQVLSAVLAPLGSQRIAVVSWSMLKASSAKRPRTT